MGFSIKDNFPILEIIWSNSPIAIIKTGDRDLQIIKIRKILGKFFITKYGVFELDSKYEYRVGKQAVYLYNATNSKPLSLPALQKVQEMYRKRDIGELVKEMQKIDVAIKEANLSDPLKILEYVVKEKGGGAIDLATEKWLMGYRAYDPASIRVLLTQAHQAKKAIESMSPSVKAMLPMVIIMGVVIGFAILVMNVGTILEAVADFIDRMKAGEPLVGGEDGLGINLPPFLDDILGEGEPAEFLLGLKTNLILGLKAFFKI